MAISSPVAFLEWIRAWWRIRGMMRAIRDVMERPDDPSPRYIRRQVRRLLDPLTATIAQRELKRIGPPAITFLTDALRDDRYLRAEWDHLTVSPPLQSILELLLPLAPDTVVETAVPLTESPSAATQRIAAACVAGAGRVRSIPILARLLENPDTHFRWKVLHGMGQAVSEGIAEHGFRRAAYDLVRATCGDFRRAELADAVDALYTLDAARAAADVPWPHLLVADTPGIVELLGVANDRGLSLPEQPLRDLIEHTTPLATGEKKYPNEYIVARALTTLATAAGDRARPLAEGLSSHTSQLIRKAAAKAVGRLKGVPDPVGFVLDRARDAGFDLLLWPQQVVYLAFGFEALVQGDGLLGYFSSSSARVSRTLRALREIGDVLGEQTLLQAAERLGQVAYEEDEEKRSAELARRWDELAEAFGPIERAYFNAEVSTSELISRYTAAQPDYFRQR